MKLPPFGTWLSSLPSLDAALAGPLAVDTGRQQHDAHMTVWRIVQHNRTVPFVA